jgi:hypothetical protein
MKAFKYFKGCNNTKFTEQIAKISILNLKITILQTLLRDLAENYYRQKNSGSSNNIVNLDSSKRTYIEYLLTEYKERDVESDVETTKATTGNVEATTGNVEATTGNVISHSDLALNILNDPVTTQKGGSVKKLIPEEIKDFELYENPIRYFEAPNKENDVNAIDIGFVLPFKLTNVDGKAENKYAELFEELDQRIGKKYVVFVAYPKINFKYIKQDDLRKLFNKEALMSEIEECRKISIRPLNAYIRSCLDYQITQRIGTTTPLTDEDKEKTISYIKKIVNTTLNYLESYTRFIDSMYTFIKGSLRLKQK